MIYMQRYSKKFSIFYLLGIDSKKMKILSNNNPIQIFAYNFISNNILHHWVSTEKLRVSRPSGLSLYYFQHVFILAYTVLHTFHIDRLFLVFIFAFLYEEENLKLENLHSNVLKLNFTLFIQIYSEFIFL